MNEFCATELPPGAVYCKFDRLLPFWSNHAVNAPYSCSFLSKFESSLGKRLGCASALDTVLLFVLCMHSAKPVQNIQLSPQIRESVLSHFTGCFLLQRKWKRNFFHIPAPFLTWWYHCSSSLSNCRLNHMKRTTFIFQPNSMPPQLKKTLLQLTTYCTGCVSFLFPLGFWCF